MFFPQSQTVNEGGVQAGLMHSIPTIGSTPAERFFALSIAGARKTLYITNSYFVPGENFLQLLLRSAKRGVDEIGRASCRERGGAAGAGVVGEMESGGR